MGEIDYRRCIVMNEHQEIPVESRPLNKIILAFHRKITRMQANFIKITQKHYCVYW